VLCTPRNDDVESDKNHGLLRLHTRKQKKDGATYIGVTNDIVRRIFEHRTKAVRSFTSRYNITRLVWFEIYDDPISAISREKEIKKWKRTWKAKLIEEKNPQWEDLYESIC
jgi:putative endonuclease